MSEPEESRSDKMVLKRKWKWLVASVLVVGLIGLGCGQQELYTSQVCMSILEVIALLL